MDYTPVNIGSAPNARDGDPDRTAFGKINDFMAAAAALLPWPFTVVAAEDLSANDPVRLTTDGGSPAQLLMEKADATDTTKPAEGYVLEDVAVDVEGGFYPLGVPLTSPESPAPFEEGSRYYVAAGGGLTTVKPAVAGNGVQEVGLALTDSLLVTWLKPMDEVPGL